MADAHQRVKQIEACHHGHDDVGQEKIDRLHRVELNDGRLRVGGFNDMVTRSLEDNAHQFAHRLLVLDQQHRPTTRRQPANRPTVQRPESPPSREEDRP